MVAAEPDAEPDAGRTRGFFWLCAALTLVIGLFLASDVTRSSGRYAAGAWAGTALAAVLILGLAALYAGCALGRLRLEQVVTGRLTLFHLSTLAVVAAVGADILIPDRDTGSLTLLLPWGITYWLHHLRASAPRA